VGHSGVGYDLPLSSDPGESTLLITTERGTALYLYTGEQIVLLIVHSVNFVQKELFLHTISALLLLSGKSHIPVELLGGSTAFRGEQKCWEILMSTISLTIPLMDSRNTTIGK
jgi:hypothetical protein